MSATTASGNLQAPSAIRLASALLVFVYCVTAAAGEGSSCLSEADCTAESCISAQNAATFPFTVDYTLSGDADSTTFIWKVCSLPCSLSDATCQPLASFTLRLADQILQNPQDSFKTPPKGVIQDMCGPLGPGLLLNATKIEDVSTTDPSQEEGCEVFSTSLFSQDAPLDLADVCQQGVTLVDEQGAGVFDQGEYGTSCMFVMELQDGTSGFGLVYEKDDRVETAFQVDSLVETNETCADFVRRQAGSRVNVKAYRKGLQTVLGGVARNLGDYRNSMFKQAGVKCEPVGEAFRHRIRTTWAAVVRDGLQSAYETQLRIAVNSGALRESVNARGASREWLPTPMRYTGPHEGREAVCIPAGSTGGGALCGPAAWDPEHVEEIRY